MTKITVHYSPEWVEIFADNTNVYRGYNEFTAEHILDLLRMIPEVELEDQPVIFQ